MRYLLAILTLLALTGCKDDNKPAEVNWGPVGTTALADYARIPELDSLATEYAHYIEQNQVLPTVDPIGLEARIDAYDLGQESQVGYIGLGPAQALHDRHDPDATHYGAATAGDFAVIIFVVIPPAGVAQ